MKTAIVTGAARGIGAAVSKALAANGCAVAMLDLDASVESTAKEITATGAHAIGVLCDVSKAKQVDQAFSTIAKKLGSQIDVLVNNAGMGGPFHRADEVSEEEWDLIFATNVKSAYLFTRRVLPAMKAKGFGRIVNVASIQGLTGAVLSSTYSATKHAMIGYTRSVAAEWGSFGITCNAICPGYVETRMGAQDENVDSHLAKILEKSPVKRMASPDEIAAMVAYLVGEQSGYINGAALTLDGGITAHVGIT